MSALSKQQLLVENELLREHVEYWRRHAEHFKKIARQLQAKNTPATTKPTRPGSNAWTDKHQR